MTPNGTASQLVNLTGWEPSTEDLTMAAAREHSTPQLPQDAVDNRSRQLNPEHDAFWRSRGEEGRPDAGRTGSVSDVRKKP